MAEPIARQDPIVLVIDFHHARLVCPFLHCVGTAAGFGHVTSVLMRGID
jgi:hypothetical protein